MLSIHIEPVSREFVEIQHRFRGLVADLRSRRFVKERVILPQRAFRSRLQDLLLDARAAIKPEYYRALLEWVAEQSRTQLSELASVPVGYDELAGVYEKAPVISLEHELLWITERLRIESQQVNSFVSAARLIQAAVFVGAYEEAIAGVAAIQASLGVSLWSVQLRVALEHLAGGLERQKQYTAEVRSAHRAGLLGFITYHTSVRNEDRTTIFKFIDDIEVRIAGLVRHSEPTKTYDRYRLKHDLPVTDAGLAEVLRVEQSQGVVDIYETFISILQRIASRCPESGRANLIIKCISQLNIDDFRLVKIREMLAPSATSDLPARANDISNSLLEGRVLHAIRLARRVISDDPWQYIYAGFAVAGCIRVRETSPVRPTNIATCIGRVLSRTVAAQDAWAQLAKLMLNLRGLPLAAGLSEALAQLRRASPEQPWRPWLIGLNSPFDGAEDRHWDKGRDVEAPDAISAAWREATCPSDGDAPLLRVIRAVGHVHRGDFSRVSDELDTCDGAWPESLRSLRALVRLHAFHVSGERQQVIALIADEGARSSAHADFLPVVGALSLLTWQDYRAVRKPLPAPISLHLLWTVEESSETASRMRFATGQALRGAGIERPSDLDLDALAYERHELIYFLRYVCVPEILDLSRLFSGTREILEERQAICGLLARIDPDNSVDYQSEIVLIANELALDEGRWIVDSTRIHVDSDGLIRWATRELAEDYARYRDLARVELGATQSFEDVLRELEKGPSQRGGFAPDNEADAVLVSLLRRLGDEFLSNPNFGLDFFLSKRVRHQSFIGLIRGPLEFSGLITTRESEVSEYRRNETWLKRFDRVDDDARTEIDVALRSFALKFDETLTQAKDAFFHLRSVEKPQGMLVLTLSERLINIARALTRLDLTFPEFIRVAVPILWSAIEQSLSNIRTFITEEIKSRISNEFDVVRARVRALAEQDAAWLEFDAAIGGAANEVQVKLDEAANWFVYADTLRAHRLFSLEQILAVGVDTALKSQRGYTPAINQKAEGDLHLHAPNLVFIHDVLFVGLGNVRKHSGLKNPRIDVIAKWNVTDATVTLSVESDCRLSNRAEKDRQAEVIRRIIAEGTHDRRTRVEEGSGFAKLAAVVLQSERGRIEFGFTRESRFRLDVTYAILQFNRGSDDAA